jgi:hypothetical protein
MGENYEGTHEGEHIDVDGAGGRTRTDTED